MATSTQRGMTGRIVVLAVLAVAIAMASVSVYWWRLQAEARRGAGDANPPATAPGGVELPDEQLPGGDGR